MERKKVFVAMSGGVDSSVAVAVLKEHGYDVSGVFMQGWTNPNFECNWLSERQDAARVAAVLGIPFRVLDYSREYYERVVSYLISEYKTGRTPNPDVMCNREIKFGLFYKWAMEQGADFIATGHYVRRDCEKLFIAKDANKDQSYFLWTLTPEIISHTLFPIGEYTKPEIRALAKKYGLPTAEKKDSQGICFVGPPAGGGNIANFLKDYIPATRGLIETASGRVVGEHDGMEFYTIGQRHGIGVVGGAGEPLYVAEKNMQTATLIVASEHEESTLYKNELSFNNTNWLVLESVKHRVFDKSFKCEARIRYRQPLQKCHLEVEPPNAGKVVFDEPQRAITPGQSVVFYRDGELLGGGVID